MPTWVEDSQFDKKPVPELQRLSFAMNVFDQR